MYTKKKEALKLARGGAMGSFIAEMNIDDPNIFVALTNPKTGHLDVWGPPRALLDCVVSCADTESA